MKLGVSELHPACQIHHRYTHAHIGVVGRTLRALLLLLVHNIHELILQILVKRMLKHLTVHS